MVNIGEFKIEDRGLRPDIIISRIMIETYLKAWITDKLKSKAILTQICDLNCTTLILKNRNKN